MTDSVPIQTDPRARIAAGVLPYLPGFLRSISREGSSPQPQGWGLLPSRWPWPPRSSPPCWSEGPGSQELKCLSGELLPLALVPGLASSLLWPGLSVKRI